MAGRYVLPHLRKQSISTDDKPGAVKGEKTQKPASYTVEDLVAHYKTDGSHGTLNRSAVDSTSITHILLFKGAHPEWPPKIYCKTNVDILEHYCTPEATAGDNSTDNRDLVVARDKPSVPVFVEVGRPNFDFLGYHTITDVTFLEPRSEALVKLLEAKFHRGDNTKERRPEQWKTSLSLRWAIVTLEPDKAKAGEGCGVAKLPPKSVTEKLNELRLRDKAREEEYKHADQKKEDSGHGLLASPAGSHVLVDRTSDAQSESQSLLSASSFDKADASAGVSKEVETRKG